MTAIGQIVDYLEYRKVRGDKTVDLEPETVAALAALAKGGPAGRPVPAAAPAAAGPSSSVSAGRAASLAAAGSPAPAATTPDFLFVGEQEGIAADRAAYSDTLRKMVAAMGYGKGQAVFTNVCIGRQATTPPSDAEMAAAMPAFREFVARARPRGIVVLGGVAARGLLGLPDIFAAHGRTFRFEGLPAIPTFHPAYMVKYPEVKRDACRDLCNALKAIGRPVTKALAPFQ